MIEYHKPVLLHESIEGLNISSDGVYVDLTYGSGGHSKEILKKIKGGKLIAFDQDSDAIKNAVKSKKLEFVHGNFRFFKNYLEYLGYQKVNGVLADLGVSSHHFDDLSRGFSFRNDALLDMRMNKLSKLTAYEIVNTYSDAELSNIFYCYGELNNSRKIADLIIKSRNNKEIKTTLQLAELLKIVTPKGLENKFLAKVFQALRIEVNSELDALKEMLEQCAETISANGRLVVITYHSLEDRLVKKFIKAGNFEGNINKDLYGNAINVPFRAINNKVVVPENSEIIENSRARSAKLRIAERNE